MRGYTTCKVNGAFKLNSCKDFLFNLPTAWRKNVLYAYNCCTQHFTLLRAMLFSVPLVSMSVTSLTFWSDLGAEMWLVFSDWVLEIV